MPTGGDLIVGKIGKDLTPEEGYDAAHHVALSLIATLKRTCGILDGVSIQCVGLTDYSIDAYIACGNPLVHTDEVGDLDKIKRIVKLVGFVNCVDGFAGQPGVINGASDTIGKVFGEKGIHARSAVGTNALPLNVAVEVEAIVEIEE